MKRLMLGGNYQICAVKEGPAHFPAFKPATDSETQAEENSFGNSTTTHNSSSLLADISIIFIFVLRIIFGSCWILIIYYLVRCDAVSSDVRPLALGKSVSGWQIADA
jgi:hypothetical protein